MCDIVADPNRGPAPHPDSATVRDVLESLSRPIQELLLELNLCSERDLRRCWRTVRQLTRDLPAFDSVWLDSLVRMRRLTPFQARILESANPRSLAIGPYVKVQRLGGGGPGETLVARDLRTSQQCVIKILCSPEQLSEESIERLQDLVRRGKDLDHPSIVVPISLVRAENVGVLVSRYIRGSHLGELLVRRGRFPANVAWEIGRQLAEGLAALSSNGLVHGDIRTLNVRLTKGGTAVLVDAGVRPAIDVGLTIPSNREPERYDGVAPELIGGSTGPDVRSDAYALGCLLWQVLAGRPPFPAGDPFVKLASHQTRTIEDVRQWAPDAPTPLAEAIRRMTAREPADRPQSFTELLADWGEPGRSGRRSLAGFRRRFDSPARCLSTDRRLSTPTRWLVMLAAMFALSGLLATLLDKSTQNVVLAWTAQLSGGSAAELTMRGEKHRTEEKARPADSAIRAQEPDVAGNDEPGLPLPHPDPNGVIRLHEAGLYRAGDINAVGHLTIVGDDVARPQILVGAHPLKLCAEVVRLRGVQIRSRFGKTARPPAMNALLLVQAQELAVEECLFDSGSPGVIESAGESVPHFAPPTGAALIAWKLLDPHDPSGQTATVRNCILLGDGPGVYLGHAVRQVDFQNVLKIGSGPLVHLASAPSTRAGVSLKLTHITCRSSGGILRWIAPDDGPLPGPVRIDAADCVYDVISPRAALVEIAGMKKRPEWLTLVRMTGEGSVAGPALEAAAWISTRDGRVEPLDASKMELEGIVSSPLRFAGEPGLDPADSEIEGVDVPRRTSDPPGIRASLLPGR